jgi:hypothetical protein
VATTILVCDRNLRAVAQPVQRWTELTAEQKFNAVGSGEFIAPGYADLVTGLNLPDSRVVVQVNGQVWCSGPVDKPGNQAWTPTDGDGLIKVNFATNEALLAERLVYPQPNLAITAQTTAEYLATNTNAEVLMRTLVNLNAGPGALAARQIPNLTLGGLNTIGTNVDYTGRGEPLTDALRSIASAGGGLGWRVRQQGTGLLFEVYLPVNRSGYVRFGRNLGNLREMTTDPEAPTCTAAIVADDGEGTARVIVERTNASAIAAGYRRIEQWVNNGSGTTAELNAAGDLALLAGAARTGLDVTAVDGPQTQFGVTYFLGDTVAVEVLPGLAVNDQVVSVKLTATPDSGEVVSPTIGGDSPHLSSAVLEVLRELQRRVGILERR